MAKNTKTVKGIVASTSLESDQKASFSSTSPQMHPEASIAPTHRESALKDRAAATPSSPGTKKLEPEREKGEGNQTGSTKLLQRIIPIEKDSPHRLGGSKETRLIALPSKGPKYHQTQTKPFPRYYRALESPYVTKALRAVGRNVGTFRDTKMAQYLKIRGAHPRLPWPFVPAVFVATYLRPASGSEKWKPPCECNGCGEASNRAASGVLLNENIVSLEPLGESDEAPKRQSSRLPQNRHILRKKDTTCLAGNVDNTTVPSMCFDKFKREYPNTPLGKHHGATVIIGPVGIAMGWLKHLIKHITPESGKAKYRIFVNRSTWSSQNAADNPGVTQLKSQHESLFRAIDEPEYDEEENITQHLKRPDPSQDHLIIVSSNRSTPRLLKLLKPKTHVFGHIIVDEIHTSKATKGQDCYTRMHLLSATPAESGTEFLSLVYPAMRNIWNLSYPQTGGTPKITLRKDLLDDEDEFHQKFDLNKLKQAGIDAVRLLRSADTSEKALANKHEASYLQEVLGGTDGQKLLDSITLIQDFKKAKTIQRSADSLWLDGEPLTDVPPHEAEDVECKLDETSQADVNTILNEGLEEITRDSRATQKRQRKRQRKAEAAKKKKGKQPLTKAQPPVAKPDVKSGVWMKKAHLARICTSFPVIARLKREGSSRWAGADWGSGIAKEMQKARNEGQIHDFLQDHGEELIDTSPKLNALGEIHDAMVQRHSEGQSLELEKGVLSSYFPVVTEILIWYLKNIKGASVAVLTADTGANDRVSIIESFQNKGVSYNSEGDTVEGKNPQWIVGTIGVLGTGFTLTAAYRCVLFEPQWGNSEEQQFRGRIDRVALVQLAPITYSYRLICRDSEVEEGILVRQEDRARFHKMCIEPLESAAELGEASDESSEEEDDENDGDDGKSDDDQSEGSEGDGDDSEDDDNNEVIWLE
ncbi:MAG: hypothetical protein M1831_003822 [Alyxoria varia]|nr:MAG: hypothetical protein M1831_003822 [Alyxoria varia]